MNEFMGPPAQHHDTCNFDVHMAIQQQILCLQVPVDDVAIVTILHRRQDLPELPPGLQLTETAVLRQVVCGQKEGEWTEVMMCNVTDICV